MPVALSLRVHAGAGRSSLNAFWRNQTLAWTPCSAAHLFARQIEIKFIVRWFRAPRRILFKPRNVYS
jgi:hypothetical protein